MPQHLFAALADRCTQLCDGILGIEIENTQEILVLEMLFRFQAAAGHQGIGDTDSGGTAKCRTGVKFIIPLQERTVNDAEDVLLMVGPVFTSQLCGDFFHLIREAIFAGHVKTAFQCRRHCLPVLLPILPEIGIEPPLIHTACIGNIEHIAENGSALPVINKGDPSGAAPDIPAHPLVPEAVFRAGGSIRPLGVYHQLLREGIFLKLLSRGNLRF